MKKMRQFAISLQFAMRFDDGVDGQTARPVPYVPYRAVASAPRSAAQQRVKTIDLRVGLDSTL